MKRGLKERNQKEIQENECHHELGVNITDFESSSLGGTLESCCLADT
jgi:hypothetical protein